MIIAIDFDGTCVTHEYPNVGKDIGAVPVLRELVEQGHQLILWTMRSGMRGISPVTKVEEDGGLADAVKWFADNEIELWGIQTNPTQSSWTSSPKAYAHLYIDDAALGTPLKWDDEMSMRPFVDWISVKEYLIKNGFIK